MENLAGMPSLPPVLPLPEEAAVVHGQIRSHLESRGEMIGRKPLWIAAHAKAADLILVTNNEREFRRVFGVHLQDWSTRHS